MTVPNKSPRFVTDLPPTNANSKDGGTETSAETIRVVIALAQRVGSWAEVGRKPATSPGGGPNGGLHQKARRWRAYGLDAEVRRDGDEYVMYARIPAVTA